MRSNISHLHHSYNEKSSFSCEGKLNSDHLYWRKLYDRYKLFYQ
jgi:hypothetical protein